METIHAPKMYYGLNSVEPAGRFGLKEDKIICNTEKIIT